MFGKIINLSSIQKLVGNLSAMIYNCFQRFKCTGIEINTTKTK